MDSGWDSILLLIAVVVILLSALRGWQRGIIRQLLSILALVLAWLAAFWGGSMIAPCFAFLGWPNFVLVALASLVIGLVVYAAIKVLGMIVFKKTGQQSVGLVRWGYGVGGGVVGLAYGVFLVFLMAIGIRLLGTVAEAEEQLSKAREIGVPRPSKFVSSLAEMKRSIDRGPAGPVIQQVDPMPGQVYRVLGKLTRVLGSPQAAQRFFEYPGALELSHHPKIVALRSDPELVRDAQKHDFFAMLRSPRLSEAANDPELQKLIGKFALEHALDYSLQRRSEPPPTPTPAADLEWDRP